MRARARRRAPRKPRAPRLRSVRARKRRRNGVLETIRAGDRVTILDRFGKEHSGRAVMRGPAGWVLNMGGPHGTPGIATEANIVRVKPTKKPMGRGLGGDRLMFGNPRGGEADRHAATELVLYVENDADLYRQQRIPILKNLWRKMEKGTYDHEKAVKLWGYLAESGAKKYAKEFGGTWNVIFTPATRRLAAAELAESGRIQLDNREFDFQTRKNPRVKVTASGQFKIGDRVQLHPGTDDWMRGDRYGEVVGFGRKGVVRVKLDVSGRTKRYHPERVMHINPRQRRHRTAAAGINAQSVAAGMGYPYIRGNGRATADGKTWLSRFTKKADGKGPAIFVGFDTRGRRVVEHGNRGRRNPTLVHQGIAARPTFHLLDHAGRAIADLYGVNLERARRVAHTIADATGFPVEIKEATGSSVYQAARHARSAASVRPRLTNPFPRRLTETLQVAGKTFRKWHGFDASQVTRLTGHRRIPSVLVALGRVPEIVYESNKWKGRLETYVHKTGKPKPLLATGPDGKGLYIVGGNVRVTADGLVG